MPDLHHFGEFFSPAPRDPAWPSLADVIAGGHRARVAQLADTLGTPDPRVAASIWFQGLAARLLSPALGTLLLTGRQPAVRPDAAWLAPDGRVAVEFGETAPAGGLPAADCLLPLADALTVDPGVAPLVLDSDTASALAGAATVVAGVRPDLADHAWTVVRAAVETHLPHAGRFTPSGRFQRLGCCLWHRVPSGGWCGDCVARTA